MRIELQGNEANDIATALSMWANHIETGSITTSAVDAQRMKRNIKALDVQQMKKVVSLRELAERILTAESASHCR